MVNVHYKLLAKGHQDTGEVETVSTLSYGVIARTHQAISEFYHI